MPLKSHVFADRLFHISSLLTPICDFPSFPSFSTGESRNPTVFQRIICQLGWMASHFLSVPSNLRTVALDSQTFTGCVGFPRGLRRNSTLRWTRGSAILNSRKACGVAALQPHSTPFAMPSDKSTSWGSELCAIYINLITQNDVTSGLNTVFPLILPLPTHRYYRLWTFFHIFPCPFQPPNPCFVNTTLVKLIWDIWSAVRNCFLGRKVSRLTKWPRLWSDSNDLR